MVHTHIGTNSMAGWALTCSELIIAVAYFLIPVKMYLFLRERKVASILTTVRVWFMLFIVACGFTHLFGLLAQYWEVDGLILVSKIFTAMVSLGTLVVLINHTSELNQLLKDAAALESHIQVSKTKIRALEEQFNDLKLLKEQAESLAKTRQEFMATVSHEIRTPLQAIVGLGEILSKSKLDESQFCMMDSLLSSAKVLSAIVNDILDFAKYQNHDFALEETEFSLNDAIRRSFALVSAMPQQSKSAVSLRYRFRTPIPSVVLGDVTRFIQIIGNLLNNSVKFTQNGSVSLSLSIIDSERDLKLWLDDFGKSPGSYTPVDKQSETSSRTKQNSFEIPNQVVVTIEGSESDSQGPPSSSRTPLLLSVDERSQHTPPQSQLEYAPSLVAPWILLELEDTGIGISKEAIPNIFKRFVQSDASVTRKFGGTGLGLAICLALVHRMGGTMHVKSVVQKGTTMYAIIPLKIPSGNVGYLPPTAGWVDARLNDLESYFHQADFQNGGKRGAERLPAVTLEAALSHGDESSDEISPRVLVADDNPVNRMVIVKLLKSIGCKNVLCVDDGKPALELCSNPSERFSCVLMDLHMPTMDGIVATGKIRKLDFRNELPVFAFTAAVTNEMQSFDNNLFDGVIPKPCNAKMLEQLLAIVQSYEHGRISREEMRKQFAANSVVKV